MSTESRIERAACCLAESLGMRAEKLKLASKSSWPDRTFMYRGRTMYIEFKSPGAKPTPLQQFTIDDLLKRGFEAHVCSDYEHAKLIIIAWKHHVDQTVRS